MFKLNKEFWLVLLIFLIAGGGISPSHAQETESKEENPLKISGFLEAYYSYDFGNPPSGEKPSFIYSYDRHNEFNINLGYLAVQYNKDRVRSNFALMAGTYTNANLAAEPGVLKNIFEANIGYKLSSTKELWLDMGVFPSHIGFESATGSSNWTLTRSIQADNYPYYETGLRFSYYTPNHKWYIAAFALNGWQRIQRLEGNSLMSFGTQVTFTPSEKVLFNSSTFIGTDTPDLAREMRYFHNFFSQIALTSNWSLIFDFDLGLQQSQPMSKDYHIWFSPDLITRVQLNEEMSLSGRLEFYSDPDEVMVSTENSDGFHTLSTSLNLDWKLAQNVLWRNEYRYFAGEENYFPTESQNSDEMSHLTTSIAIFF